MGTQIRIIQPRDINGLFYPIMKNIPKIFRLYVSQTLVKIPNDDPLIHYMEDLLLAHPDATYLQRTSEKVLKDLESLYLMVVTDKAQTVPPLYF